MDAKLIELVRKIKDLEKSGDKYLTTLPGIFNMLLIDNEYSVSKDLIQAVLMRNIFADMYDDVTWFLYEWRPGFSITTQDGTEYIINTEEEYYKYLENQ